MHGENGLAFTLYDKDLLLRLLNGAQGTGWLKKRPPEKLV